MQYHQPMSLPRVEAVVAGKAASRCDGESIAGSRGTPRGDVMRLTVAFSRFFLEGGSRIPGTRKLSLHARQVSSKSCIYCFVKYIESHVFCIHVG